LPFKIGSDDLLLIEELTDGQDIMTRGGGLLLTCFGTDDQGVEPLLEGLSLAAGRVTMSEGMM
jgi:hypothetical protein